MFLRCLECKRKVAENHYLLSDDNNIDDGVPFESPTKPGETPGLKKKAQSGGRGS